MIQRFRILCVLLAALFFSTPAMAECVIPKGKLGPDGVYEADDGMVFKRVTPAEGMKTLEKFNKLCPDNPMVLRLGITAHAKQAELTKDAGKRLKLLEKGLEYSEKLRKTDHLIDGQRSSLLTQMVDVELQSGKQASIFRKRSGVTCSRGMSIDVEGLAYYLQRTGYAPGAMQFISDIADACDGKIGAQYKPPRAYHGLLLVKQAEATPDAPDAGKWFAQGEGELGKLYGVYAGQVTDYGNSGVISAFKLREIAAKLLASGRLELLPEESWFTPEGLADPGLQRSIALKLDEAAAGSDAANTHRPYREVIARAVVAANAGSDPAKGKLALYEAAKAQAYGNIRHPANKDKPQPPSILWNWVNGAERN